MTNTEKMQAYGEKLRMQGIDDPKVAMILLTDYAKALILAERVKGK